MSTLAFIVGMPRAATTYLCALLNSHPDIACYGESLFWGRQFVPPKPNGRYSHQQLAERVAYLERIHWRPELAYNVAERLSQHLRSDILADTGSTASPAVVFESLAAAFCKATGKSHFIEKTPHHIQWIDRISEHMPSAKFIVLSRDPYDFLRSYKYQGLQYSAAIRERFAASYHPLAAALVWRRNYRAIVHAANTMSGRAFVMDTKEVSDEAVVGGLLRFLGVRDVPLASPENRNRNSSFEKVASEPKLDDVDLFWMNAVANREIIEHRGATIVAHPRPGELIMSCARLPVVFLRVMAHLPIGSSQSRFGYLLRYLWQ